MSVRMSEYRYAELATYNSEVARGIVHTEQWKQRMRLEQELYDHGIEMRMRAIGAIRLGNGGWLMVPEARLSWWRRLFGPRDKGGRRPCPHPGLGTATSKTDPGSNARLRRTVAVG